jgi:methanogenic corrinoid protein MtbC1
MASTERTQEIFKGLCQAVVSYDEETCVELSKRALEEDVDPYDAVMNGLAAGMKRVGELYTESYYFIPEMLLCADALYAGLHILQPHIKAKEKEFATKEQIVIGVVEGDIHDIGKNVVKVMFEAAGWTVHDLGANVKLERFAEEQLKTNSEIVAISALMTTSMMAIPKVIEMVKAQNPNVGLLVGGAPITRDIAMTYGADGYAKDASSAVQEALRILHCLRNKRNS